MIENFCMGTRRLELCSSAGHNARPGWLTVGLAPLKSDVTIQAYDKEMFDGHFAQEAASTGGNLVPTTSEVESLRPRSPGPVGVSGKTSSGTASLSVQSGLKTNPQGIGRHTNRSATPSASQQLELQQQQQQAQAQHVAQIERQRAQMEALQQQTQMQQQQWAVQQAQFMSMFQGGNPMAGIGMGMGMMPQYNPMMGMMPGMMGQPNQYGNMQFQQGFPQQQYQQGFQSQAGYGDPMQSHMMSAQYGYGGPNQQYQGARQ